MRSYFAAKLLLAMTAWSSSAASARKDDGVIAQLRGGDPVPRRRLPGSDPLMEAPDMFSSKMDGSSVVGSRSLQMDHGGGDHSSMHFVESMCNHMLDTAACTPWSTYFNGADMTQEIKIPCGECVTLDASPGDPLHGSTLDFGQGLNIVGKLIIPNDAQVHIVTKYVYVQGELIMPQPTEGSSSGISSIEEGDITKITLYGTDDLMFMADNATDNVHLGMKDVSAKAFVVAGGRVDIRAMDPTCPTWLKLQSIQYGTPLPNVALNKPTSQSSTYEWGGLDLNSYSAVDGDEETTSHTKCQQGVQPWWEVDLEDMYTVDTIKIVNQKNFHWRFFNYTIDFMDAAKNVVHYIHESGYLGERKTFDNIGAISFRYIKITLGDKDTSDSCLHFKELEVYGYPSSEPAMPLEHMNTLTVGEDAARCWSTKGSRILLTSDTFDWDDSQYFTVADIPYTPGSDKLYMLPMIKKKTAVDETFGHPDFAVEVALLDRSLVIEGAQDEGEFATLGGHFIVLHTPHVHQHVEGALLQKMGQQGRLGRYPLHFHMSECVHGSTLAKNVIWESHQRCIVIHGSHNVTISENVAFDTQGHCYMLEDGGEWDNSFLYNLGSKTRNLPANTPQAGESDNHASTFWITNPANHWRGNVAAGSQSLGFWFELMLRGPSASLEINQGFNPRFQALGTFDDNTAHSNLGKGITTYESGYEAPSDTIWNNIKSFKNNGPGVLHHGTSNITFIGGLLADNVKAARNFGHSNAVWDGVQVIGRSEHVQSMIDEGRISTSTCANAGGISVQPNQGLNQGTIIKNSVFSGYDAACTDGVNSAIYFENDQVVNGVLDTVPTFLNNTFGANDAHISACMSIETSATWVRYIAVEDQDGSMSGTEQPGFYIQDEPAITNFIDEASCHATDRCLRFCPGACLRVGIVSISQDLTTRGFQMQIQDGDKSATVDRGEIFQEMFAYKHAPMPLVLPAPTSGKYSITFTDKNGHPAWPGYATLALDKSPACSGGFDQSQISLDMPPPDDRCDDLFHLDDYTASPIIHGWQTFFTGFSIDLSEAESPIISTTQRKTDGGNPYVQRSFDASCFAGLGGRKYTLSVKIRITDADDNYVETDGLSITSPRLSLILEGFPWYSWYVPTNGDGTWHEFTKTITLPVDSSLASQASIRIDHAWKKEYHLKDFGMVLEPLGPSASPSNSVVSQAPIFLGCWADWQPHALPFQITSPLKWNTIEGCHQKCNEAGYTHSGLQWEGLCFCGNDYNYDKYGPATGCQCLDGVNVGSWKNCVYGPQPTMCTEDSSCAAAVTNPCEEGNCNLQTELCDAPTPIEGCQNGARLDRWFEIGGTAISDLTDNPLYPDSPDATEFLDVSLEAPTNIGDSYGSRLQAYIMPPVTCDWNLYIASDNNSELYLSSNDDPVNKNLVASVNDWTWSKEWKKDPSQKGTVSLVKGELYYLEAIHKAGWHGDNLAVGWECLEHGFELNVISAEYTTVSIPQNILLQ